MTLDHRRSEDRHSPGQRHGVGKQTRIMGCALGLAAAVLVLFLVWSWAYA